MEFLQLRSKALKILHAPVNIANQPWRVSRIEKEKGFTSDLIVNYKPSYGLAADVIISDYQKFTFKNILKRFYYSLVSIFKYDVLHYYFGKTLFTWDDYFGFRNWLWYWDLKIAKFLGKKILMTMQGCDLRTATDTEKRYEISACHPKKCPQYQVCKSSYDSQRNWLIKSIFPYVDHIFYLNPDLGYYLDPKKSSFLPYASVLVDEFEVYPVNITGKIKIFHAPSVPTLKGTPEILNAIEILQQKYEIELVIIKDLPYAEAIKKYHEADLVIDQINVGWYGAFAVEVMAMGKPVACYLREEDFKFLPQNFVDDIPVYNIDPLNLTASIEKIILDRENWLSKGMLSRKFVEKWHNPNQLQEIIFNKYIEK